MSKQDIVFSIVMPTLNSELTIEKTLKSIRSQTFDQKKIEILVIDGGSIDKTIKIAKEYGAKILNNTERKPESAKFIGINEAKGKYAIFMDSDEEFINPNSLKLRAEFFNKNSEVKNIITTGMLNPSGFPKVSRYMNTCGDAFSYFIYRMDGEDYLESLEKRYKYQQNLNFYEFTFAKGDLLPIVDAGTHTFDLDFLKKFPDFKSPGIVTVIFKKMAEKSRSLGVIKEDYIYHNSNTSLGKLFLKTKWKLIGNIFHSDNPSVGYVNREKRSSLWKSKEILFVPYAATMILPFLDAIIFSLRKKDLVFMVHFILSEYILFYLFYYYLLKLVGIQVKWDDYGK